RMGWPPQRKTTVELRKAPPQSPRGDTKDDAASAADRFLPIKAIALRGSTPPSPRHPSTAARRNGRVLIVSRKPKAHCHRRTKFLVDCVVRYRKRRHGHSALRTTTDRAPARTALRRPYAYR